MKKTILIASLLAAFTATGASAANLVANGSFNDPSLTGKAYFVGQVDGWSGGGNGSLTFIDSPGTADDGSYLSVYPGFPTNSPDGGDFVEQDGDPSYSAAFYQTITGLTAGKTYQVTFYQAAGQQLGFTGPTTERWSVSLGAETQLSDLISLPEGGTGPWEAQSLIFTATDASEVLSFLAVGTPNGQPPISFLDGVTLNAVPEPATWGMMIVGLGALGALARRRNRALAAA